MTISSTVTTRSARFGLRVTPEHEAVLRHAADVVHKLLTDFILDSACQTTEQTLLDQCLVMVSGNQYQVFLDLLDGPSTENEGLRDLFAHPAPEISNLGRMSSPCWKP